MKTSIIVATSIWAILTLGSCAPSISCPSAEDLHPCTCKRLAYGLHVACMNFDKNSDLIRACKVLRDYHVQNFGMHGLYLTEVLPTDLFDGLEISELRVENSKLKFSQPAFKGLDDSLYILNVAQKSMIKSSEDFSLARLPKLTELNIKSNILGKVRNEWLNDKIPGVHTIVMEKNEITEIENDAFSRLTQLKSISLADNRIKSVARSMFPRPALKLTKIDLSMNEIKSLPYDFFFDMPNLKEVIMIGNDLETLPERTWISMWEQLDEVRLKENSLVCDEKLDWLRDTKWPRTVVGSCMSPADMKGKTLKEVYNT